MPYTSENAQFQPLLVIECRGLEFTGFKPKVSTVDMFDYSAYGSYQGFWKCVGSNGTLFDEVDLEGDEWTDYDEKVRIS